jgi:hypothetical protein
MRKLGSAVLPVVVALGVVSACGGDQTDTGAPLGSVAQESVKLVQRCASSNECGDGDYCTTEDGACDHAPCAPGDVCLQVCYGVCKDDTREQCGDVTCSAGLVCCNASCGTCVEPDGSCTLETCFDHPLPPILAQCGPNTCAAGMVCCNESCGICTEPGGYCTQQSCDPPDGWTTSPRDFVPRFRSVVIPDPVIE